MAPRSSAPDLQDPTDPSLPLEPETPPRPSRPLGGIRFSEPTPAPSWTEPTLPGVEGSASLDDAPPLEQGGPSDGPRSSSKASSATESATTRRAVRDAARQAVLIAGGAAHQLLARDEPTQAAGLYLADDDDAENIGDPIASMVNRRGGIGAAGNPDLADAIAALIGLALYVTKQLARYAAAVEARQEAARAAAAAVTEG